MFIYLNFVAAFILIDNSKSSVISINIKLISDKNIQHKNNSTNDISWAQFLEKYNKTYSPNEMWYRKAIFKNNKKIINDQNEKYMRGESSYRVEINYFADLTKTEFFELYKGYQYGKRQKTIRSVQKQEDFDLPASVNWITKKIVTPVKNQKNCGSCYAFSTTGSLEGQYALKYHQLVSFSEQNIVDCSQKYGNEGCNGGLMDNAFTYIERNGGLDTEKEYPYEGNVGTCRYKPHKLAVSGYKDIMKGSESQLQLAVARVGPIAVGIDASSIFFQFYSGGVYDNSRCSTEDLDHGVLVVGYGVENGVDYWLVKNSWGSFWGENGYIKMSRGKNNQCGIATAASYPLL